MKYISKYFAYVFMYKQQKNLVAVKPQTISNFLLWTSKKCTYG